MSVDAGKFWLLGMIGLVGWRMAEDEYGHDLSCYLDALHG